MAIVNIYTKTSTKEINRKLDALIIEMAVIRRNISNVVTMLQVSAEKEKHMGKELDELQAAVEENTTVDLSIMTLVDGLAAQIESLKNDPVKLAALAKSLRDSSALTVAKVLANTPQEPPPVEPTA